MSRSKEKTVVLLCFALAVVSFVIVQKSDLLITKAKYKDLRKTSRPPQVKPLLNIATPQLSDPLNTSSPKVEGLLNKRKPTNERFWNKRGLNMEGHLKVPKSKENSPSDMLESATTEEANVLQNKPKPRMEGIPNTPLETLQKEGISATSKPKVMATNHKCPHGCVSKGLVFVIIILIFILWRDTS